VGTLAAGAPVAAAAARAQVAKMISQLRSLLFLRFARSVQ
jgi:hypothetical protein